MKYNLLFLLLVVQQGLFAQPVKPISIFQEGRQVIIDKEEMVIDLKNQSFSIRYHMTEGQTAPKILFLADKKPFTQLGQGEKGDGFGIGSTRALGYQYKSYFVNTLEYDYKGNYYLPEYAQEIGNEKGIKQYEFTIKQLEGVEMKDFFLDTLYVAIYFGNNKDYKFDEGELIKFTLHFPNSRNKAVVKEDVINLAQINFNTFNANTFYRYAVQEERIFKGLVTDLGYQYNQYSERDSAYIQYSEAMYSAKMKSVSFRNLRYPIMEAMTTLDGRLMAVAAVSEYNTFADLKKANESLYEDFGDPVRRDVDGRTSLTWDIGDRVLQMSFEIYEAYPNQVINRIFIASKEFVGLVKGTLGFGIWYRFD